MSISKKTLELHRKYDEKIPETLKRLSQKEPISHIAKDFGFYKDGFVDYLESKGLYQKRAWARKPQIDMKILQKAYKMYTIEGKNISEIAKIVKVDRHALSRNLKKAFNLKVLQDGRKSLNEDYFEEINNPEVSYWLGFMYADGWNREQVHEVGFSQKKEDRERVYAFKAAIDAAHKIQQKNVFLKETGKTYPQFSISIKSKKLSLDLAKWGCVSNKTYVVRFPDFISNALMSHFIRGFFDGDGCISYSSDYKRGLIGFTSASQEFLMSFQDFLLSIKIKSRISKVKEKKNWELKINGNKQLNIFFSYVYDNTNDSIRMSRKYEKFVKYLEHNNCRPELKAV